MKQANTIIWISLLLLTCLSFSLGENRTFARVILAVAGIKFALVAWQFMDLRKAAFIWSVALLGLLGIILGMALLLV